MPEVVVSGVFDDLRSRDVRFLEEAAKGGPLQVLLWSDHLAIRQTGQLPLFPEKERVYLLESIRYVHRVTLVQERIQPDRIDLDKVPPPFTWVIPEAEDSPAKKAFCVRAKIDYRVLRAADLDGFPSHSGISLQGTRKKVIVTGCYDWLHSGHVCFFEQASAMGDLYVSVGNDANIRSLKGTGHPLLPQEERAYMVQSVRYVAQAFIAQGSGWLDAEAEIDLLHPDFYVVNEDGDREEKRAFCRSKGIEYVVLKREPRQGLPARESTKLRGY